MLRGARCARQIAIAEVNKRHRHPIAHYNSPMIDALERLSKPFKVPFATRSNGSAKRACARLKNYDETIGGTSDSTTDYSVDENGSVVKRRKIGALLPRQVLKAQDLNAATMRRKFCVPFDSRTKRTLAGEGVPPPPPPPLGTRRKPVIPPRALHDPTSEFAIVLYDPTVDRMPTADAVKSDDDKKDSSPPPEEATAVTKKRNPHRSLAEILGICSPEEAYKRFADVPVVIDPHLAKVLRPHQIAGVKFLYRCLSGLVDPRAKGCIMADEMGLGKTLQCIALMWTLLRQSPRGRRTIDKCIIVCPSSLVRNWANEIIKWLGPGSLTPLAVDGKNVKSGDLAQALSQWSVATGRNIVRPVLIILYETLRRNVDRLAGTEVGLMLADEGHRLKNGDSLTFTALNALRCERRVILSGTPIQNDLSEYFLLLNFANPGYLGSRLDFKKNFENDILKGRDSDASESERATGDRKLAELSQLVNKFIIRRTNDILSKYLPVKYEHVVFVGLSPMQHALYTHFITSPEIKRLIKGTGLQPLKAIGMLKKLCNHPDLLNLAEDLQGCEPYIPEDYQLLIYGSGRSREVQTWHLGKFEVLTRFLHKIRTETDDKIVLISNYTQTLDLIEKQCRHSHYGCLRLDGTMNINKRQKLVDRFNDALQPEFIFLLLSKAGGCGINLIGANRLVLIDPDWNPAADQQALARVWRDGQKKDCFIYRFITVGTIEEKIFQRQSMKLQLSSCVVDEMEDVERNFSAASLKQLFNYKPNTRCETHDNYGCQRCTALGQRIKLPAMLYGDATTWNHLNHDALSHTEDILLKNEANFDNVRFTFQYVSHLETT